MHFHRNIEDNNSTLPGPEISAIDAVRSMTVKKYSSFKHFFRSRTLSGRQRLGWSGKRSAGGGSGRERGFGPETDAASTTLARFTTVHFIPSPTRGSVNKISIVKSKNENIHSLNKQICNLIQF